MITVSQNQTKESIRNYVKNQGYDKYEIEHNQKIPDIKR